MEVGIDESGSTEDLDETNNNHGVYVDLTESVTSVDNSDESSTETAQVSINGPSSSMDNSSFRRSGPLTADGNSFRNVM